MFYKTTPDQTVGKLHNAYHTNQMTKHLSDFRFHKAANRYPASIRHCTNADLMLGHRLRRWPNIKSALVQCLVFAGHRASRL